MTGVGAEDFQFQNKKKLSSPKAKMCGRFQTPTLIMAKFSYPNVDTQK